MARDLERSFTHSNPPPESGVVRAFAWQFPDGSLHRRAMSSIHNLELGAVPEDAKAVLVRIVSEERYQELGASVPLAELLAWLKESEKAWRERAGPRRDGDRIHTINSERAGMCEALRNEALEKWGGGKTEEEVRG